MELLCCKYVGAQSANIPWQTILSSVASIGAVLTGILAIIFSGRQTKRNLNEIGLKEKRETIQKKLNEFYGPLLQLRMKSHMIYEKFKKKYKSADPTFATLTYLLSGKSFTGNDDILLQEILKIGELCENLIHEKAGLIDDTHLRTNVIPRATTHFLLLRLAYKGALHGEEVNFSDLTFPQELDGLLEKRKKELEDELNAMYKPK